MSINELEKKDQRYRESLLKKFLNLILVALLKIISILPFWILFGISDFFYLLIRYIFKYRNAVILENLRFAFPEKDRTELNKIRNKFYQHFCDIFFENIKLYSMSFKQAKKRISIKEEVDLDTYFENGESIILLGMHHNNWEWSSFLQTKLKHKLLIVYNPMRGNQAMEKFLLHSRQKWGCIFIPVHKSNRIVLEFNKRGEPIVLGLGADQSAAANSKLWATFLNREAPFFPGPEKIAKRTNQPVYFHRTRKIKRGFYEIELIKLIENPKELESKEILLMYIKKMEEIIKNEPENYLW